MFKVCSPLFVKHPYIIVKMFVLSNWRNYVVKVSVTEKRCMVNMPTIMFDWKSVLQGRGGPGLTSNNG